jgi:hypothetical protein
VVQDVEDHVDPHNTWVSDADPFDTGVTPEPALQEVVEVFERASETFGKGSSFMNRFDSDEHAEKRQENLYYPFSSKDEWALASFLLKSGLSMTAIDEFLHLVLVSYYFYQCCISYRRIDY